ncbi:MAG: TetR/AcrR family transcriptional regulator [Lentisphaerae bacterium]|nr:MAG: TetR/AcrR family transcriptional regulator [Lentisphaerota bacterium]
MAKVKTSQRLLQAALECFAEKGYYATTVEEICNRANANIAAVNYHFGDKHRLYERVWEYACELAERDYPLELPDHLESARAGVTHFVRNMLKQIFDDTPSGSFPRLMFQELSLPSPILPQLLERHLLQRRKLLFQLLRNWLREKGLDEESKPCLLDLLHYSIVSQVVMINIHRRAMRRATAMDHELRQQMEALMARTEGIENQWMLRELSTEKSEQVVTVLVDHIVGMVEAYLEKLKEGRAR